MKEYIAVVATTTGMPQITHDIRAANDERAMERARYLCEQYYGVRWFMNLTLWEITKDGTEQDERRVATYRVEPRVVEVQGRR